MDLSNDRVQELKEKIFAKRQQIAFEEQEVGYEEAADTENPDVLEEAKNFSDHPENAVDPNLLKALDQSKAELNELIRQLDDLTQK